MAIYKNTPPIVTNGLILNLDFANRKSYPGTGSQVFDLAGSSVTGSIFGTGSIPPPTFTSEFGGSLDYLGLQFITASRHSLMVSNEGDRFTFQNRLPFTAEVFVRMTDTRTTNLGYPAFLTCFGTSSSNIRDGWILLYTTGAPTTTSQVYFERFGTGTQQNVGIQIPRSELSSRYFQFVGTYDGTNWSMYYNGNLVSTITVTSNISGLYSSTHKSVLFVGSSGTGSQAAASIDGNIAIARIYNRGLSQQEIMRNYNATKSRFNI